MPSLTARGARRPPTNLASREFSERKFEMYRWLREEAPVYQGRMSVIKATLVSRYDDCITVTTDPRFVRNRTTATGGSRFPFPVPKSVSLLAKSMIQEDDPEHRRLRGLVQKAFTPRAIARMEDRVEAVTHELLDRAGSGPVDLIQAYALPTPVAVISEMVGVSEEDMPRFMNSLRVLTQGMSGWNVVRTLAWDLRGAIRFVRELVQRKRANPGEDILSELIRAEEAGDQLSEDEVVSMVFLLVIAGYETTVHLIANGVIALLEHPEQLDRLRRDPSLMEPAVEEMLRFVAPIQSTKPNYPIEDVEIAGVTIPKGTTVMPLLGAANRDPRAFDDPETFDIGRTPNRHLGFSWGRHFCLGAHLARMETRVALINLMEHSPKLRLAVDPSELRVQNLPGWHRHESLPVVLG